MRLSINDYHGALEDFSVAVDLDPKYPIHFCNRGIAKFYLGDYKGAIDDFTQAINIIPRSPWFNFNRGVAKCFTGDFQGAINDFTAVIESEPKNVKAHILRGKARGGFKKGCYNPLNDSELISIFQGNLHALELEITEIEKSRLCRMLNNN
jgi:lipoprotein NlpI